VGLLTKRFRTAALFCAIGMHTAILIAIGRLGLNFNTVVWSWNVAMIAFLLILFFRRVSENRTGFVCLHAGTMNDEAFDRLPDTIEDYVYEDGPDRNRLNINEWSLGELNVPSYPEPRIYKNVARQICGYDADGTGVELVVQGKLALVDGNRRSVYRCSGLRRRPR
jgi:hypothetical protein